MKRPQFGLRLMLLIIAFIATCTAWRVAVERAHDADRNGELFRKRSDISIVQNQLAAYEQEMQQLSAEEIKYRRLDGLIESMKREIAERQKEIEGQ